MQDKFTTPSILSTPAKVFMAGCLFFCTTAALAQSASPPQAPVKVTFYGAQHAAIASGVAIPKDKAYYWSSGIGAPLLKPDAPVGSPERYGDTQTQAVAALNQIQQNLQAIGLDMKDVTYLRVYVAPDRHKENKPDYKGWFDAYARFFGTAQNPTKVARATVGVASLVNPDWLIEIEAVAVYPDEKAKAAAAAK